MAMDSIKTNRAESHWWWSGSERPEMFALSLMKNGTTWNHRFPGWGDSKLTPLRQNNRVTRCLKWVIRAAHRGYWKALRCNATPERRAWRIWADLLTFELGLIVAVWTWKAQLTPQHCIFFSGEIIRVPISQDARGGISEWLTKIPSTEQGLTKWWLPCRLWYFQFFVTHSLGGALSHSSYYLQFY